MSALYIHIPFCKKPCGYCDFYKECTADGKQLAAYVDAVGKEMEFRRDFLNGTTIDTIFFGGGTPSVYPPAVIQGIIDKAGTIWDLGGVTEVTVEINPDDATEEYLTELAKTDVNRVSFGVQSFIDRDLELLGRRHNADQAVTAICMAHSVGFDNISIDLIFGIPGMLMRDWDRNIMKAMRLNVDHISAYHLSIEPGTLFAKMAEVGKITPVPENESEEQYLLAHRVLSSAGFDHYEISNYARTPEKRGKHNCNYWCGEKYLGIGPSAHSYDGDQRSFVVSSLGEYLEGAGTDKIYGRETLSKAEKYNEFVMTSLRTCCGVRRDIMTQKFGSDLLLYFEYAAEKFLRQGLLVRDQNEYKIPPEKFMVSDAVIRELFLDDDE